MSTIRCYGRKKMRLLDKPEIQVEVSVDNKVYIQTEQGIRRLKTGKRGNQIIVKLLDGTIGVLHESR